jgi:hypothetical protein
MDNTETFEPIIETKINTFSDKFANRKYIGIEIVDEEKNKIVEPIKMILVVKPCDITFFTSEECKKRNLDNKTFGQIVVNDITYHHANTLTATSVSISRATLITECKKILSVAHVNEMRQKKAAKEEREKRNKLPVLNRGNRRRRRGGRR